MVLSTPFSLLCPRKWLTVDRGSLFFFRVAIFSLAILIVGAKQILPAGTIITNQGYTLIRIGLSAVNQSVRFGSSVPEVAHNITSAVEVGLRHAEKIAGRKRE